MKIEDDITPTASGSITRYTVQREIEGLFVGNKYHVVAIVNAGDLTNGITDIDGLKNYQFREVIVTHGSERWFLMASEKDSDEIEIRANNSQYNPTWVNVDVERMTARVDCAWKWKEFYEITGENMPSEGEEQNPGEKDKVKILGAALVNRYRSDTYAFKRVTDGTNLTAIDYLGDEKTNADGIASNYVLDPKTISGKNSSDYTFYYTEYVNWDVENDFINPITGSVSVTSGGDRTYYLLDYVRENINTVPRLSEAEGVERYATGIMFKAQYTPAGFAEGETFYVYPNRNGERTIYTENELRKDFPEFDDLNKELWDDSFPNLEIYTDGVCYYIYWIRHADDSDTYRISPMEYAIVRNNIYQLYVNSISALGNPEPDSHIEEVTSEIHVNVKNWTDVDVTVPVFD